MDFTKMQGAGNDFIIVDARKIQRDWPQMAIDVCDRHLGIGADSLIILLPSDRADFGMRTFDTDGSEAETCGNGIRCVARYLLEKGLVSPAAGEMTIETAAAINRIKPERKNGKIVKFRVNMGQPRFAADKIPAIFRDGEGRGVDINDLLVYKVSVMGIDLVLNLVSMGNPHAVHFCSGPVADFPLGQVGPLVERMPVFPNRVNFEVVHVLNRKLVEARVWERGVGETRACGSGACAITVVAKSLGLTEPGVAIRLPGGTLNAIWNGTGDVVLDGPAEVVFEGKWPD
jgi:diaminopimelate epimerase